MQDQEKVLLQDLLCNLNVPRGTFEILQEYVQLLEKWNKVFNLVSRQDISHVWSKHVMISAELINHIPDKNIFLADLGSGAGFPGLILSFLGVEHVTLVESNRKKATFLQEAARLSKGVVEVINDRFENIKLRCNVLTSRAMMPVPELLTSTKGYVDFDQYALCITGSSFNDFKGSVPGFEMKAQESKYNKLSNIVIVKHSDKNNCDS